MSVMAEIQRQQADVQQMQARHLAQHEQRLHEQDHLKQVHERMLQAQAEGLIGHEQRLREQQDGMRLHDQRMAHIDMRLAEITDKLDGLISFQRGQFPDPQ